MASLKSYGEWALVTGASAGIGTAFARELAAQSVNVVLVARRADRLEALAAELREKHGVKTRVVPEDLERDGAAERLLEWVRDLEIGILVNNAGFSMVGRFERVPREKILGMIRVNCLAVAALTHAFLPPMQARRRGAVIIVSSVAGYQPLGFAATYGATKAFDLQMEGELDAAIERYQQSIALHPTAEAQTFLGWTYSCQGRLEDAIAQCKEAIAVD